MSAFLRRHQRIALDTSIFIYHLEDYPRYAKLADEVFTRVSQPGHYAVSSTVTLAELLVKPYRNFDPDLASSIYGLLSVYPHLEWIAPDLRIADAAAEIRAVRGLKIPDALQAATAIRSGATGLVANDPVFRRVPDFETLLFDELL